MSVWAAYICTQLVCLVPTESRRRGYHACMVCVMAHVQWSGNNLLELVLSLHDLGPRIKIRSLVLASALLLAEPSHQTKNLYLQTL